MNDEESRFDLGAALTAGVLVLIGAWIWDGPTSRWGEWLAAWAIPTALISLSAAMLLPRTRGVSPLARVVAITTVLAASGAALKSLALTSILIISVIRSGLRPSWNDVFEGLLVGGPSGAWDGAVAGLIGGLGVALAWPAVEAWRGDTAPNPPANPYWMGAATVVATVGLAGVAEAQHHAPLPLQTGCMADCDAWVVLPAGRVLGSALAALALGLAVVTSARGGAPWRPVLATALLAIGVSALGLGHTSFTTTVGPRLRRATLGLPPMPVPLARDLVDVTVTEYPGWILHTVAVTWEDGTSEQVLIGLGPFRPKTSAVFHAFQDTAADWRGGVMPGTPTAPGEAPPPPEQPAWEIRPLSPEERAEMTPTVWREGCPVGLADLRVIRLRHHTPDGGEGSGEIVVHADVANDVQAAFFDLYRAGFPITKVVPIQRYNGSDDLSMADDNTSGFNCRAKTGGGGWSAHSYGRAVDINPLRNPYVKGARVLPPAGKAWLNRDPQRPGVITPDDVVVRAFANIGWKWGGAWTSAQDYQHFSESGE